MTHPKSWSAALLTLVALACGSSAEPTATTPTERSEPMMVIRVVVDVKVDSVDAFIAHLNVEAPKVRELAGCLRYQLFRDPSEPTRFLLYEEWSTEAAFEAYRSSELLSRSFAVLGPMMAGPPDSQYFAASPTGT
ncbi:MAG: antibiotic biosynthesis monooxygenase [Deltaproteobacteria bacterium]|nr:antibiotic biosynthesis monooxygenase [Deltaproteobacteria bacterium]